MILIDTNIISEMMKSIPTPNLISWIDQQSVIQLYVSTVTIAEISYGINVLSAGNRRNLLEDSFNKVLRDAFEHRILSFDEAAAHFYGKIMSRRKEIGKPLSIPDGQIAAIARANSLAVATRNIKDFSDCGLDLINPF
ncbi:MAG: type II toxin-antitoxin system VapC family toxin [Tatlockia sp.]|nr:type II toxin-antitoxin system VapC family toxin [Tatlockia sp.]